MTTPENILVIKHGALGDIILATGAFAAIRRAHPGAHIVCLTTKPYAELMAQTGFFNEIWVDSKPRLWDRKALGRLRAMLRSVRWDWVYDLQISKRSTKYQWLLARPWPKISNVSRWASHGWTDPIRHSKHALDNLVTQLALAGIHDGGLPDVSWMVEEESRVESRELSEKHAPTQALPISTRLSTLDSRLSPPYALLVPGGAAHRPEKRWPADQYAALAQELVSQGITPVLLGTKAEQEALDAIAARVPQAIHLGGKTTIPQLAELARNARLAVGNDTGPMHVIAAAGCPSLVLFSAASNPVRSAPRGPAISILREADLRDLPVDRVLVALQA